MKYLTETLIVASAMIIACLVCFALGEQSGEKRVRNQAVELGHAHYNPTNAYFEWKPIP